jgi:hypothetical protein
MVLVPANSAPGAECLLDPRRGSERRLGNLEEAGEKGRAAFLGNTIACSGSRRNMSVSASYVT